METDTKWPVTDAYFFKSVSLSVVRIECYQSRISRAERLFNYDVIDSHAVGCNSNKQNDPIDDALRGHHALASLPAGIWAFGLFEIWIKQRVIFPLATVAMAY